MIIIVYVNASQWVESVFKIQLCKKYRMLKVTNSCACETYWEKAKLLLKIFHLLYKHTHLLVCGCVPGTSLCASPRATGKDAVGKLSTQWARKLTLVNREALEHLVVLVKKKKKVKSDWYNLNSKLATCNWDWTFNEWTFNLNAQFLKMWSKYLVHTASAQNNINKQWI